MSVKITVYRFRMYDVSSDEFRTSRRWGTRDAIRDINGAEVALDTAALVDPEHVQSDIPGLTARNFDPYAHPPGFQTYIRS